MKPPNASKAIRMYAVDVQSFFVLISKDKKVSNHFDDRYQMESCRKFARIYQRINKQTDVRKNPH